MLGENKKYTRCYTDRPADDKDKEREKLAADCREWLFQVNPDTGQLNEIGQVAADYRSQVQAKESK